MNAALSLPPAARWTPLDAVLWLAQVFAAVVFCGAGFTKLGMPLVELQQTMPWTAAVPAWTVRAIGAVDLAGGIGILLPAATRVLPWLTPLAAAGCALLQLLAAALHAARGEWSVLPLNAALLAASAFVLWGRTRHAPIAARPMQALEALLWLSQAGAAAVFVLAGLTKIGTPIDTLHAMLPWTGAFAPGVVRAIGAVDLAGGLGLLLPAATRILPRLTVWAAAGCALLQVLAIGLHLSRGETGVLPLNAALLGAALFTLWGRGWRYRLPARA